MVLSFGVLGTIVKMCCPDSVTNAELVSALVGTVDPNNQYGDRDQAASRLLSCQLNFPTISAAKKEDDEYGSNRLTDIKNLAKVADRSEVAQRIQTQVLPLLDPDKKIQLVPALFEVISADSSLEAERRESFHRYTGTSAGELLTGKIVCLPMLLAGLLLYAAAVVANREGRKTFLSMDDLFFESALKNYPELEVSEELDRKDKLHKSMPPFLSLDADLEKKIPVYLARGIDKYSKVKTLIFGDALVDFYEIYVCNDLSCDSTRAKARFLRYTTPDVVIKDARREDLANVYNNVIISGTGGQGKSMMMRHLFLSSAKDYEDGGKIPLLVTVRDFGEKKDITFEDYLFTYFDAFGVGFTKEDMKNLLKFGRFFLLFDGLDEINGKCIGDFQKELSRMIDRYPDNQFVLSTRPMSDYYALQRFQVLDLMPFTEDQAVELVTKLNFRPDAPEIKQKFLARLKSDLFLTHEEFVRNPLLLTIMLMTFEEYGIGQSKRHMFYEEAFMTLAKKHDLSKGAYERPLKTGLSVEKIKSYFAEFCARTYGDYCYEFTADTFRDYFSRMVEGDKSITELYSVEDLLHDLTINLCLFYYESGKYHFIHRSFQEYFCALYFSWQTDMLEQIGNLFDSRPEIADRDETLIMLYAMIPERMENDCFRPYLQKKIKYYEKNMGYLTFVEEMYPQFSYHITDVPIDPLDKNRPQMPLYGFIRERFMKEDLDHLQLPFVEDFIVGDYYQTKHGEFVDIFAVPSNGMPHSFYGEDESVFIGHEFVFSIHEVLKKSAKYKEFLEVFESADCLLHREYEEMKKYYESLEKRKRKPKTNIFDSMSRRNY